MEMVWVISQVSLRVVRKCWLQLTPPGITQRLNYIKSTGANTIWVGFTFSNFPVFGLHLTPAFSE